MQLEWCRGPHSEPHWRDCLCLIWRFHVNANGELQDACSCGDKSFYRRELNVPPIDEDHGGGGYPIDIHSSLKWAQVQKDKANADAAVHSDVAVAKAGAVVVKEEPETRTPVEIARDYAEKHCPDNELEALCWYRRRTMIRDIIRV